MANKQKELPGVEREHIKEIEDAAEKYVAARDKRMRLTEQEVALKTNLLQILLTHESKLSANDDGDKVYRYDDEIVILRRGKLNVKVKAVHDDDEDEDDE